MMENFIKTMLLSMAVLVPNNINAANVMIMTYEQFLGTKEYFNRIEPLINLEIYQDQKEDIAYHLYLLKRKSEEFTRKTDSNEMINLFDYFELCLIGKAEDLEKNDPETNRKFIKDYLEDFLKYFKDAPNLDNEQISKIRENFEIKEEQANDDLIKEFATIIYSNGSAIVKTLQEGLA